jgi:hypothetical protein
MSSSLQCVSVRVLLPFQSEPETFSVPPDDSVQALVEQVRRSSVRTTQWLGALLPCIEATTPEREPRWLAPSSTVASVIGGGGGVVVRLFAQFLLVPVTNLLQREHVLIDVTQPLLHSSALAFIAATFKLAAEHVRLYINGRLLDLARPLHGQAVSLAAQIVLQDASSSSSSSSSLGTGTAALDDDAALMPTGVSRAPLFAVPLDQTVGSGQDAPWVVLQTVALIRRRGLETEGLFRLSGPAERIGQLKKLYDSGRAGAAWRELRDEQNVHTITGVLKLWLRELPDALLGAAELCGAWLDTVAVEPLLDRVRAQRSVLARMSRVHQRVLDALFELLHRTAACEAVNKMGLRNLAVVFGPAISGAVQNNALLLAETNRINSLTMQLIRDYPFVFRRRRVPAAPDEQAAALKAELLPRAIARALYDYEACDDNEMSLAAGQLVVVTYQGDGEGWWQGFPFDEAQPLTRPASVGNMPGSYLELTGQTVGDFCTAAAAAPPPAESADDCELRDAWSDDEARPRGAAGDLPPGATLGRDRGTELARIKQRIEAEQRQLRELAARRAALAEQRRAVLVAEAQLACVERAHRREVAVAAAAAAPASLPARVQALQSKLRGFGSKCADAAQARDELLAQLRDLAQQLNDPKKTKKKDADRIKAVQRSVSEMRALVEQDKPLRDAASGDAAMMARELEAFVQLVLTRPADV